MNLKYYFMPGFTKEVSTNDDAVKKYLEFLSRGEIHENCDIGSKIGVECEWRWKLCLFEKKKCFFGGWKRESLYCLDLNIKDGYYPIFWEFPKILEEDDNSCIFGVMKTKKKEPTSDVWIFAYSKKYGIKAKSYTERALTVRGRW